MNALENYANYLHKLAVAKRLYAQSDRSRKSWVAYVAMADEVRREHTKSK